MYVETHIKNRIKEYDNTGSCSRYATYLTKENDLFFNHNSNNIDLENAIKMIDDHSKGQLGKKEAKWYAPLYSLSEKECQYIAEKITGRKVKNYNDLSDEEQIKYNLEVQKLGRLFQDEMAKNFEKEDIGIKSGEDLMYIGVVENQRTYKGYDEEVLKGEKKQNDPKPGFNTHIHIIQSRKANNEKKSKISPTVSVKSAVTNLKGNKGKKGFNRNQFYQRIEERFDKELNYNRKLEETFQIKKLQKIKTPVEVDTKSLANQEYERKVDAYIETIRKIIGRNWKEKKKYIPNYEIKRLIEKESLLNYFQYLEDIKKVQFIRQNGDEYIFNKIGSKEIISVSSKTNKWNNFSNKDGGGIISAIQNFENKKWIDAIWLLKEKQEKERNQRKDVWLKKREEKRTKEEQTIVLDVRDLNRDKSSKLMDNLTSREGIYKGSLVEKCKQIKYRLPNGKEYWGIGIENLSGGWTIHNGKFENKVGKSDLIFEKGTSFSNQKLLVFDNLMEYLEYINSDSFMSTIQHKEDVILLNGSENFDKLDNFINSKNYESITLVSGSDKLAKNVRSNIDNGRCIYEDYRDEFKEKMKNNKRKIR